MKCGVARMLQYLLEKFLLLDELEHLVAQLLSTIGIEVENIAAQTGVRHIYHIDALVFLGESMLGIFHALASLLAFMRDSTNSTYFSATCSSENQSLRFSIPAFPS